MLDDISLFIQIVQNRGLAATAAQGNIPAATITRRLQKLESSLGVQLIHRSAHKFNLTAEGEIYYRAYVDLVEQFRATSRSLSGELQQLSGKLTVLAPTNASVKILQPMWAGFIRQYPDIQLNLHLNNEMKDIHKSGIDIALRIGPQADSALTQKRLGSVATLLIASPDYLHINGEPARLKDLQKHRLIVTDTFPVWHLSSNDGIEKQTIRPRPATMTSDIGMAAQLARDGLGIALLPHSEIVKELECGEVRQVLKSWTGPQRDIFAVWSTGRLLGAKARCLLNYMQEYISGEEVMLA